MAAARPVQARDDRRPRHGPPRGAQRDQTSARGDGVGRRRRRHTDRRRRPARRRASSRRWLRPGAALGRGRRGRCDPGRAASGVRPPTTCWSPPAGPVSAPVTSRPRPRARCWTARSRASRRRCVRPGARTPRSRTCRAASSVTSGRAWWRTCRAARRAPSRTSTCCWRRPRTCTTCSTGSPATANPTTPHPPQRPRGAQPGSVVDAPRRSDAGADDVLDRLVAARADHTPVVHAVAVRTEGQPPCSVGAQALVAADGSAVVAWDARLLGLRRRRAGRRAQRARRGRAADGDLHPRGRRRRRPAHPAHRGDAARAARQHRRRSPRGHLRAATSTTRSWSCRTSAWTASTPRWRPLPMRCGRSTRTCSTRCGHGLARWSRTPTTTTRTLVARLPRAGRGRGRRGRAHGVATPRRRAPRGAGRGQRRHRPRAHPGWPRRRRSPRLGDRPVDRRGPRRYDATASDGAFLAGR